jgi:predicted RNA-binding protein with PIN domain
MAVVHRTYARALIDSARDAGKVEAVREELVDLAAEWAEQNGHEAVVVWEGAETADDRIAREVTELGPPIWVVTSDRELRRRVEPHVERIVGGGSFARELQRR